MKPVEDHLAPDPDCKDTLVDLPRVVEETTQGEVLKKRTLGLFRRETWEKVGAALGIGESAKSMVHKMRARLGDKDEKITLELDSIEHGETAPDGTKMTELQRRKLAKSHMKFLDNLDAIRQHDAGLADKVMTRWFNVDTGAELTILERHAMAEKELQQFHGKEVLSEKEKEEMKEVVAIGDLNGSLKTLEYNLKKTGVLSHSGKWAAGRRTVEIHGDILADRGMDGFEILLRIRHLRAEAQAAGGNVKVIAGNHDDLMFKFLTERTGEDPNMAIGACWMDHNSKLNDTKSQGIGLLEVTQFTGDRKMMKNFKEAYKAGRLDKNEVLTNMRNDARGRIILEEMTNMILADRVGDTLFIHTDPTNDLLKTVLDRGTDDINRQFQTSLRESLLEGKEFEKSNNPLFNTFLNGDNRTMRDALVEQKGPINLDPDILRQLKEKGINRVVYGHSVLSEEHRKVEFGGIQFVSVDRGSLRGGNTKISAALLKPEETIGSKTLFNMPATKIPLKSPNVQR